MLSLYKSLGDRKNMKELDIIGIIKAHFGDRLDSIEEEKMPTIYDILRSPKYNKLLREQQKANVICKGFTVANVNIVYRGIRVRVKFDMPFTFYNEFLNGDCNREGRVVVPVIDLDEISIKEPEFTNKINKKWFHRKISDIKYNSETREMKDFSYTSLVCKGHRKYSSGIGIRKRIVSYIEYLLDCIDFAIKNTPVI